MDLRIALRARIVFWAPVCAVGIGMGVSVEVGHEDVGLGLPTDDRGCVSLFLQCHTLLIRKDPTSVLSANRISFERD